MDKEEIIQKILSHGYRIYGEDKILASSSKAYDNIIGYIKDGKIIVLNMVSSKILTR